MREAIGRLAGVFVLWAGCGVAAGAQPAAESPAPADVPPADSTVEHLPPDPEGFTLLQGWDGSITFGLNGSQGNTETLNFRADASARRETEGMETRVSLTYRYGQDDGEESENRLEANGRNDWKQRNGPWRFFTEGTYIHDEFQAWRNAVSAFAGPGYEFISNDTFQLVGRAGAGGRYEDDGPGEGFTPEGLLGLDAEWRISERQRLQASSTYFPSFDEWGEFRLENKVKWEITVDPEVNLVLNVGVEHRHDSQPGDDYDQNDVDFFIALGWTF